MNKDEKSTENTREQAFHKRCDMGQSFCVCVCVCVCVRVAPFS